MPTEISTEMKGGGRKGSEPGGPERRRDFAPGFSLEKGT
jgi:hypothetical protein